MARPDVQADSAAASAAGAQLAEILALALIERGLIDRDDVCAELELLADARRTGDAADPVSGKLIQLANSIRAARTRQD